jgi:4-amino-4-deoxy-L-arabinose transferase-like glycosyltransferase
MVLINVLNGNIKQSAAPLKLSRFKKSPYLAVLVLLAAFAAQLWYHATRTSPVLDEPAHIFAGYRHWECKDFGINPEHPPLVKLLATAPLIARRLPFPDIGCGTQITPKVSGFVQGNIFIVQNGVDEIVVPARLATALISLILAVVVFLAAREMFGLWAGIATLALFVFEPNIIANGSIVTTDLAISATAFAAVYALYRYGKKPTPVRFLMVAVSVGLMLSAKHSALLLLPVLFFLVIADGAIFRNSERSRVEIIGRRTAFFCATVLIGLTILWAMYGFQYYSLPGATSPTVSLEQYAQELGRPETINSRSMKIVQGIGSLSILPESYVVGLTDIAAANSRNTVILNRPYTTGQWWYFPLAFVVKSSVALLLLLPVGLVALAFEKEKRRELLFLLVPAISYFAISLTSGMNLGVRHLLPVYPFFIVIAASGSTMLAARFRWFGFGLAVILLFHAFTPLRIAPHYMAFSNDFAGGLNETHNYMRDAGVDYGQSLKLPAEYIKQNNIAPEDCWFAGRGNYVMVKALSPCRVLPSGMTQIVGEMMVDPVPPVIEGIIFVSANELPPRGGPEYSPIAESKPVAILGGAVLVYQGRFDVPRAAAMSRVNRAFAFIRLNQLDEAKDNATEAINIYPADPRPHAALANVLVRQNMLTEAKAEFEKALELAQSDPATFLGLTVGVRKHLARINQSK